MMQSQSQMQMQVEGIHGVSAQKVGYFSQRETDVATPECQDCLGRGKKAR